MVIWHIKLKGITNAATWLKIVCPQTFLPADTWDGVSRSKFNFFRTWSCCISNKRTSRMQQHGSKYYACRPPPPPIPSIRMWLIVNFQLFHDMVYQIKGNHEMQQHSSKYFTCRPPSPLTLGMGPIGRNLTFSDHGHVDIKLNGIIKCSNIVANILPADPYTPPPHHPHPPTP